MVGEAISPMVGSSGGGMYSMMPAWVGSLVILFFIAFIGIYIYLSIAYMKIGEKAGLSCPGVAWANPIISIFEISKMHWWPWPTFFIGYLVIYALMLVSPVLIYLIFALLIFMGVIFIMWQWKTFEAVQKPGWWAVISPILCILGFLCFLVLPFVGSLVLSILGLSLFVIAGIIYLVLVGIAAWG
jgi:hypothetical protein